MDEVEEREMVEDGGMSHSHGGRAVESEPEIIDSSEVDADTDNAAVEDCKAQDAE